MSSDAVTQLNALDLSNLKMEDVKKLNNPTLRDALTDVLLSKVSAGASHQNHSSHGDTSNSGRQQEVTFAAKAADAAPKAP